jgi:hypothetical protein
VAVDWANFSNVGAGATVILDVNGPAVNTPETVSTLVLMAVGLGGLFGYKKAAKV